MLGFYLGQIQIPFHWPGGNSLLLSAPITLWTGFVTSWGWEWTGKARVQAEGNHSWKPELCVTGLQLKRLWLGFENHFLPLTLKLASSDTPKTRHVGNICEMVPDVDVLNGYHKRWARGLNWDVGVMVNVMTIGQRSPVEHLHWDPEREREPGTARAEPWSHVGEGI